MRFYLLSDVPERDDEKSRARARFSFEEYINGRCLEYFIIPLLILHSYKKHIVRRVEYLISGAIKDKAVECTYISSISCY